MKRNYKKLMRMALALCIAAMMFCSVGINAQAAGFKKSFTKTVTLKGGQQCVMRMNVKSDTKVKVTISTTKKRKNMNIQALIAGEYDGDPYHTNLDSKHKKGSFAVNVGKGTKNLWITNYGVGKIKVKVKVSGKGKVIKFTKKKTYSGDVG